jgi:hypothetical protein
MSKTTTGDLVNANYNTVEDLVTLFIGDPLMEKELLNAVKAYASAYARFALQRVSQTLREDGYVSAAMAADDHSTKIEGLL